MDIWCRSDYNQIKYDNFEVKKIPDCTSNDIFKLRTSPPSIITLQYDSSVTGYRTINTYSLSDGNAASVAYYGRFGWSLFFEIDDYWVYAEPDGCGIT